ncbi:molybdopterin-dependent oxidoreductase [Lachnospiraceae bacterium ZAX-1]
MKNFQSELFQLIGEFFLKEPDRQVYKGKIKWLLKHKSEPLFNGKVQPKKQQEPLHKTIEELLIFLLQTVLSDTGWASFVMEQEQVIQDIGGFHLSFWESTYYSEKKLLLDQHTLNVQKLYGKWNLVVSPARHEICDHIGFEFAFVSFLLCVGTKESIEECKDFLRRHLFFLTKQVSQSLSQLEMEQGTTYVYATMLKHLLCYLSMAGCDQKDEALKAEPEHNQNREEPSKQARLKSMQDKNEEEAKKILSYFFETDAKGDTLQSRGKQIIYTGGRHNCGGRCAFRAEVEDGMVLALHFDPKKTPSVKHCVRGHGYLSTYLSPRRLRYPMKRIGERGAGHFKRISWDEAILTITDEWKRISKTYGPESRYVNYSSGVSGLARPDGFAKRLLSFDGGYLAFYNSYSSACAEVATPYSYGQGFSGSSSCLLEKSELILLWGHNPKETIFGAYLMEELIKAQKRGAQIIVIDSRKSATVFQLDAQWIPIKPSTDGALIDAIAYVVLSEGLEARNFINTYCIGFDEVHMPVGVKANESYEAYLFGMADGIHKTPSWAEHITGVPESTILNLARQIATKKPTAILPGLGAQRQSNGEQWVRGIAMLCCLTGNVGIAGGGAGGTMVAGHKKPILSMPVNPYPAVIPSFLWTDALVRGSEMTARLDGVRGVEKLKSSIKMILNLAGNTLINQHSDINRTDAILRDTSLCEFIVVSDVFLTPSARYADILLPAPSFLESENITEPWDEGDYLLYSNVLTKPLFESRFEYDWISQIAKNLGLYEEFAQGNETVEAWLKYEYEKCRKMETELPDFDTFKAGGGYFYKDKLRVVAFEKEIKDPKNYPFLTPSGKIEIFSKRLYDLQQADIPGIPKYTPGFEGPQDPKIKEYPLQLIAWHSKRICHSIHDNNPWMDRFEKPMLYMNIADAKARGIETGTLIEVYNDRGRIAICAFLTENIIKGVVAITQGGWYTPDADGVDIRGSINVLTTQRPTPLAKGNPQHTNLVEVKLRS